MSGINPRRPNLFVVKDPGASSAGTLVNLENLDSKQTKIVNRYLSLSRTSGVCVGALCGVEDWDLRPVVIEGASVTVTRFADPDLMLHKSNYDTLRTIHMRMAANGVPGFKGCGEGEGQLWLKRKFYNGTLGDALRHGDAPQPVSIEQIQHLIAFVHNLHENGLFHGHLSPSNLAVEDGILVPLDYGFCAFSNRKNTTLLDLAPELQSGFQPTFATDVYGLGQIIRKLCSHLLTEDHQRFINSMLAPDPFGRPAIHRVEGVFRSLGSPSNDTSSLAGSPRRILKTGRLIERRQPSATHPQRGPQYINPRGHLDQMQPVMDPFAAELLARGHLVPPVEPPVAERYAVPQTAAGQPPQQSSGSNSLFLVGVLLVSVLLYLSPVRLDGLTNFFSRPKAKAVPFTTLWKSGQPSMMQQVATAAAEMDPMATSVIVQDVMDGSKPPLVRTDIIKTAFDSRWVNELTDTDKLIAMKLALYQLLPTDERAIPSFDNAHPGVILALLGNMKLDSSGSQFSAIPVSRMATLPNPIGPLFSELGKVGVENLEDVSAKALSHVMVGDLSEDVLIAYFSGRKDIQTSFAKAGILMPLTKTFPDLENRIYDVLSTTSEEVGQRVAWFAAEGSDRWKDVDSSKMFAIMGGRLPDKELTLEQYADLLKFPAPSIRKETALSMKEKFFDTGGAFLAFLATSDNALTRSQTISIVKNMKLEGEAAYKELNKLFETKPDPQSILRLLMARSSLHALDPFNVTAARYLKDTEWQASMAEIKKLLLHPEPLARALAYARLNPAKAEDAAVLRKMMTLEPHTRLREEIQRKLDSAKDLAAAAPPPAQAAQREPSPAPRGRANIIIRRN